MNVANQVWTSLRLACLLPTDGKKKDDFVPSLSAASANKTLVTIFGLSLFFFGFILRHLGVPIQVVCSQKASHSFSGTFQKWMMSRREAELEVT